VSRCFLVKNPFCPCSLEENDKIKSEINPRKINEPKTPYHGPMEEEPGCGEIASHNHYFGTVPLLYTCSVPDTNVTVTCLQNVVFVLAGEPGMSPLRLEAEVNTALNSAYRQVSHSFHCIPDSVGRGASCDSSDILACKWSATKQSILLSLPIIIAPS